jgi:hypothetical protein
MKITLIIAAFFISLSTLGQGYWQQEVNYNIDVSLIEKGHSLKGNLDLEYTNNSPDQLSFIWFHLWPNAYKKENTAFVKQIMQEKDGKKRWKNIKEKGYIDSLAFSSNGIALKTEAHPEHIDIIKVYLPAPLQSGQKIRIATPFFVKLPSYNSRSGFEDESYMVCQWYPKPAVYDRKGWHEMPYLDRGEFFSEFGSFNVNITVPSKYIVGATGTLQTASELDQYKAIGTKNLSTLSRKNSIEYKAPASATKTLNYKGDKIHDFAWFANKDFVIRYDTLQLPSGKMVDVFAYHHPDGNKNWVNSISYIEDGVRAYSSYLGEYEYPVVQAVEGPKNDMSGGMEYPMITLITSPSAKEEFLDAVITHEVGHNWFAMMLASNERDHAWLDEGINTYFQFRYEADKYKSNSIIGDDLPKELKQKSTDEFLSIIYNAFTGVPIDAAIDAPSASFKSEEEYGMVSYLKTSMWMYLMERNIGKEKLDWAMQQYFKQWKFKHPYPEDLRAVLEKETGQDLSAYFDILKKRGSL